MNQRRTNIYIVIAQLDVAPDLLPTSRQASSTDVHTPTRSSIDHSARMTTNRRDTRARHARAPPGRLLLRPRRYFAAGDTFGSSGKCASSVRLKLFRRELTVFSLLRSRIAAGSPYGHRRGEVDLHWNGRDRARSVA